MSKKQNYWHWTAEQAELVKARYPDEDSRALADEIGCTVHQLHTKAHRLGVYKTVEYKQKVAEFPRVKASQFMPGEVPWNKGKSYPQPHNPTRFKKNRPIEQHANYRPIGSFRLSKEGYWEVKWCDDRSIMPIKRWKGYHRLVWEQHRGSIPKGHIIVFKDRKKGVTPDEITIDMLECISRAENANRNHPNNKSPELAKLCQLKGAITRQVNRILKESNHEQSTH